MADLLFQSFGPSYQPGSLKIAANGSDFQNRLPIIKSNRHQNAR